MSAKYVFRGRQRDDILIDAVDRSTPISLTHRSESGWVSYASRFLEVSEPGGLIAISAPVPRRAYLATPRPHGEVLGVSFRKGHKKCIFSSRLDPPTSNDQRSTFTLSWPTELQQVRRRAYERALPPPGPPIAVRFWCVAGPLGESQEGRRVRYGELEDLSAGGMRVLISDTDGLDSRGTFRCLIAVDPHGAPIVLEAVLRHQESAAGGRTSLGLGFMGLDATEEGRVVLSQLARIVSQFQRVEVACRT